MNLSKRSRSFLNPQDLFSMDRFFDSEWIKGTNTPAVNVKEEEKSFELELAAPGLSKDDFKITVENRTLSISSEKREEKEESEKEGKYTRKEFSYSSFNRSFSLPENTNEDDISAIYKDGVLRVSISKTEDKTSKTNVKQVAIG